MNYKSFFIVLFVFTALVFQTATAQDFSNTRWMDYFNRGKYDSVVVELTAWVKNVPWEKQGIPLYFLGESYYNLALTEETAPASIKLFQNAFANFEECLQRPDLQVSTYRHHAVYKQAWSLFRLAEIGSQAPINSYTQAFTTFMQVEDQAPDDLPLHSAYMAGEARLRQVIVTRYDLLSREPVASEVNSAFAALNNAREQFERVLDASPTWDGLKIAAQIRLLDVDYQFGKLYQGLTPNLFSAVNDGNKRGTAYETAAFYFSRAAYPGVSSRLTAQLRQTVQPILIYSDALTLLNTYLMQPDNQVSLRFSDKIDSLQASAYDYEILFRRGNRDQANPTLKEGPFFNLSSENSYYARAAAGIPEANYWLGFVRMVLNQERALDDFNAYLESLPASGLTLRKQVLREDALLRRHGLALDRIMQIQNRNQRLSQLRELVQRVEEMQPRIARIQSEKDQLLARARISVEISRGGNEDTIAGRIYTDILNRNIDIAEELIQELLPQAASTTGQSRASYLDVLEILYFIIQEQRPDEAQFYRGITTSLNAEISPSESEKRQLFSEAAAILANVGGQYRNEAQYIRARSLFFAQNYDEAQQLLTELVNQNQSVRALFYLGELFRAQENGVAARECFQVVQEKTQNKPGGTFWYNNATAAISLSNTEGSDQPLEPVNLTAVQYPDVLLRDDTGQPITYEGLADYDYLQIQLAQESVDLLQQFGLPKRTIYPSKNRLAQSHIAAEGLFPDFVAPIDERRGAITAGLRVVVVSPVNLNIDANPVTLDGQALDPVGQNVFAQDQIRINTAARLRVASPGYYPYIQDLAFQSPGMDSVFVVLTPELQFVQSSAPDELPIVQQTFPERLDQNIILTADTPLPPESPLAQDLSSNPYLRDYVYHPQLQEYLVVDAINNRIVRGSSETSVAESSELYLDLPDGGTLDSPEGITVDSAGNIYIVDWGVHRVLVFRPNGTLVRQIGGFGRNDLQGEAAHFIFPTRVTVAEDRTGVPYRGKTVYPDRLLLVADRNGVHLLDERGHYLDTAVAASAAYPEGSFYGIQVQGYGDTAVLYVAEREEGEVRLFVGNSD